MDRRGRWAVLAQKNIMTQLSSALCLIINYLGSVYMRKLALARVSYQDDFLISYRVCMMTGPFHLVI